MQLPLLRLLVCIRDAKAYPKTLASPAGSGLTVVGSARTVEGGLGRGCSFAAALKSVAVDCRGVSCIHAVF